MVKNFSSFGPNWIPGTIAQKRGPLTYLVEVSDGRFWKRHVDHIKKHHSPHSVLKNEPEIDVDFSSPSPSSETDTITETLEISDVNGSEQVESRSTTPSSRVDPSEISHGTRTMLQNSNPSKGNQCYPTRQRQPPKHFETQTW